MQTVQKQLNDSGIQDFIDLKLSHKNNMLEAFPKENQKST